MAVTTMPSGYRAPRELEDSWRAMPEEEQPFLIFFFGLIDYKIVAVCDTREEAEELLALWQMSAAIARFAKNNLEQRRRHNFGNGMPVSGFTRCADPEDFSIRQQHDIDALTKAIIGSYR